MRTIRRGNILIILLVLALSISLIPVQAQGSCLTGLKNADCQLITDSSPNLAKLTTMVMNYTFSTRVTGTSEGTVSLYAQGNGPLDATQTTRDDLVTFLSSLIMSNAITGTITIGNRIGSGAFDLRLVDGMFYFRDRPLTKNRWYKFSMDKVLRASFNRSGQSTAMLTGDGLDLAKFSDVYTVLGLFNFTQASSKAGSVVDGQPTTQITLTYDIEGYVNFLLAPENRLLLREILAASLTTTITDSQIDQAAASLPLLEPMLKNTKLSLMWNLGTKDKLYHGYGINFSTQADAKTASLLENKTNAQPFSVMTKFQITLSKIGQPVKVDAVPTATDVTEQMISPATSVGTPLMP